MEGVTDLHKITSDSEIELINSAKAKQMTSVTNGKRAPALGQASRVWERGRLRVGKVYSGDNVLKLSEDVGRADQGWKPGGLLWHARMILEFMLFKYKEPHAIVFLSFQGLNQTDIEEIVWLLIRENDKVNGSDCEIQAVFEVLIMVNHFSLGVEFRMDNVVLIENPVKIMYSVWEQHELSILENLKLDLMQSFSYMLGEFVRLVVTVFSAVIIAGMKPHTKHKWREGRVDALKGAYPVTIKVELPANHLAPFLMYEMFHSPRPSELVITIYFLLKPAGRTILWLGAILTGDTTSKGMMEGRDIPMLLNSLWLFDGRTQQRFDKTKRTICWSGLFRSLQGCL
ncbi:unnamed protein product [Microthlaspi erraticum]|uniref:Uncharacterized protein n=1 Tax=Microthlaspi erraticum TaxID=1685480 RepID=A0A6D2LP28_9BRAS|nr:unnamed protein product [Microthlaspi erraticum]